MSVQQVEEQYEVDGGDPSSVEPVVLSEPAAPVEVRRNAAVAAGIGVAAAAVGIAYLWRAAGSGSVLDWAVCALMATLALIFLRSLFDARTPLLVIDELGVRMRLAHHWRGLPWDAIDTVLVQPRRGLLRDGRVVINLHYVQRAVEGLDGRARRQAALNRRLYGGTLAVPLGLTTRLVGARADEVADRVAALSEGRAQVVTLIRSRSTVPSEPPLVTDRTALDGVEDEPEPAEPPLMPARAAHQGGLSRRMRLRRASRATEASSHDQYADGDRVQASDPASPSEPAGATTAEAAALRRIGEVTSAVTTAMTSAVTGAVSDVVTKAVAPVADRDAGDLKVRAIARLGEPVAPLVIDDFRPEPAYDPVIGPELAAARTRVGLSVDELADRTRIRPHVIESIEVDDFAACGGDFYARGHIRTLARVLGKDPVPLLELFEARYASAPVNARTVFEAELSTGMVGSMRRTSGGPNWALLVGAVLALVMVWSLVRLFAGAGDEVLEDPPPMLNGSGGIGGAHQPQSQRQSGQQAPAAQAVAQPVATTLTAINGGTRVMVRDGEGTVVYQGDMVIGEVQRLEAEPPVTVVADDGSVLSVSLDGRDLGFLSQAEARTTRTYQRPLR